MKAGLNMTTFRRYKTEQIAEEVADSVNALQLDVEAMPLSSQNMADDSDTEYLCYPNSTVVMIDGIDCLNSSVLAIINKEALSNEPDEDEDDAW